MLKLKLQYFGHLIRRVDSLEKTLMLGGIGGRRIREQQRMRWLDGIRELVMDREAWRAVIHGVAKSRTRLSDWTELSGSIPTRLSTGNHQFALCNNESASVLLYLFYFLVSTYKWKYTVFIFVCWTDFTKYNTRLGHLRASLTAHMVKNLPTIRETWVQPLAHKW